MRDRLFRSLQTDGRGSFVVPNIEPFNCISNLTVWPTGENYVWGVLKRIATPNTDTQSQ